MTDVEREYMAAWKASERALERLQAAKARLLAANMTPTEAHRHHKTAWIDEMLQAYRAGERDTAVLAQRFKRTRNWVNCVLASEGLGERRPKSRLLTSANAHYRT